MPHVPVTLLLLTSNTLLFMLVLANGAELWHTTNSVQLDWGDILGKAQQENASCNDLAGQIEHEVNLPYADSFEQLAKLHLSPAAPSATALEILRSYA